MGQVCRGGRESVSGRLIYRLATFGHCTGSGETRKENVQIFGHVCTKNVHNLLPP